MSLFSPHCSVPNMNQLDTIPDIPELEPGLQLLEVEEGGRDPTPLQSVVLDHLLLGQHDSRAIWVDALDYVRTDRLATLAPRQSILDQIHVARGFTAYQHASLIDSLYSHLCGADTADQKATAPGIQGADHGNLSVVVAPALDGLYRADDVREQTAEDLLLRNVARLSRIARDKDIPVVVTRARADDFSAPIEQAAEQTIHCRKTEQGIWFGAQDAETLVYPVEGGYLQTTLAYWEEILQARTPLYDRYGVGKPEPITPGEVKG